MKPVEPTGQEQYFLDDLRNSAGIYLSESEEQTFIIAFRLGQKIVERDMCRCGETNPAAIEDNGNCRNCNDCYTDE